MSDQPLREQVAALIYPTCPARREGACADCDAKADAVLAVVRERVEALPVFDGYTEWGTTIAAVERDAVRALFEADA